MEEMNVPSLKCNIEIFASINPSEDPRKVESAILNIFPNCEIKSEKFSIKGISNDLHLLEKINDTIHSMQSQRSYSRAMKKNLDSNSTWFYLNKQAAFVGKIALCEESAESPLGPIKVVVTSPTIDRVIDWLILE